MNCKSKIFRTLSMIFKSEKTHIHKEVLLDLKNRQPKNHLTLKFQEELHDQKKRNVRVKSKKLCKNMCSKKERCLVRYNNLKEINKICKQRLQQYKIN